MNMQNGIWFIIISQLIWGVTPAIVKFIPLSLPSTLLVTTRFLLASVVLFAIILFSKKYTEVLKKLNRRAVFQIIFLGIIGSGLADLFMVQAIRNVGVILAIMIARLEIPLGVIMAGIMLKEKISTRVIVATLLSFLGVIFVSYGDNVSIYHNQTFYMGIGFALVAAFLWAFSAVFAKKILSKSIPPVILTFGRLLTGGIFNLTISVVMLHSLIPYYHGLTTINWLSLLFLAFISSALAYFMYYKGLEKIAAAKVSILLSLSIVIALFTGVLIGETLTLFQWGGIIAIAGGIYLTITKE